MDYSRPRARWGELLSGKEARQLDGEVRAAVRAELRTRAKSHVKAPDMDLALDEPGQTNHTDANLWLGADAWRGRAETGQHLKRRFLEGLYLEHLLIAGVMVLSLLGALRQVLN